MSAENASISSRVIDALIASSAITAEQAASARSGAASDSDAGRSLIGRGLVSVDQLSTVLEEDMGFPRVDLTSYAPDDEALALVPASLAQSFQALPLFEIEGVLTVAIGDPSRIFSLDELGAQIGYQMDAVLVDAPAVAVAITQNFSGAESAIAPEDFVISAGDFFDLQEDTPLVIEALPDTPAGLKPGTAPAQTVEQVVESDASGVINVDLDVLAFADEQKVAVLVSDILEQAVARGATRIHLLPYKSDFFLVFRIRGRLEKAASAPLSMQQPLIDGFKSYARLSSVAANRPALGRLHAEIGGKQIVLTVSSVPTVAGQRLVLSITYSRPQPKSLIELGMSDAEGKALGAMVERGRGLLLVAAPVGGGRSTTYYSLLQHAAQVGKTVYSVERAIEYEIPAVAQVLVSPGEPIGASSYFAAGMRQDTDVMALDSIQSVDDLHLAIEAAGLGKLVIATFAAGGVVSAVRRLLDMGAEPVSLGSALTLGVGQRMLRMNCPNCGVEEKSPLVAKLPGADKSMTTRRGTGCPNCAKSGFAGATGIFELLPFTEPVRASIARGSSEADLLKAANAAGMRPMIASGLAKVQAGLVSPEELDRVMRYAQ